MKVEVQNTPKRLRFDWLYNGQTSPDEELNAPILKERGVVTLPSLGSIVPGWTLTFPSSPCLNLNSASTIQREMVLEQANMSARRLSALTGRVFHFEHGPETKGSIVGCGLDLAHLHTVALDFDLVSAAMAYANDLIWTLHPIRAAWMGKYEYVTVWESGSSQRAVARIEKPISQFFRKVIATELGIPSKWNYRDHAFRENVAATRQLFNG